MERFKRRGADYHCDLTNEPPADPPAADVTKTYALRWQAEILFKALKSHGRVGFPR